MKIANKMYQNAYTSAPNEKQKNGPHPLIKDILINIYYKVSPIDGLLHSHYN